MAQRAAQEREMEEAAAQRAQEEKIAALRGLSKSENPAVTKAGAGNVKPVPSGQAGFEFTPEQVKLFFPMQVPGAWEYHALVSCMLG